MIGFIFEEGMENYFYSLYLGTKLGISKLLQWHVSIFHPNYLSNSSTTLNLSSYLVDIQYALLYLQIKISFQMKIQKNTMHCCTNQWFAT